MLRSRLLSRVPQRDLNAAFVFAAASYMLFSALDVMSTVSALQGGLRERNVFGASVYASYGSAGLWALKAVVVAAIVAVLVLIPRRIAVWVATALTLMTAVAVVSNLQLLARLG